ncbi:hypothetical protein E3N88_08101 [Mikania micrantha]|uniref:Uncharacterized protein n=1 Tax=Mikania micrantha TaxID=192012 RepID=A0A5N6PHJ4_9ASTR|nr:hypothetical protein E3N88_08101 [Mikania micrantha]
MKSSKWGMGALAYCYTSFDPVTKTGFHFLNGHIQNSNFFPPNQCSLIQIVFFTMIICTFFKPPSSYNKNSANVLQEATSNKPSVVKLPLLTQVGKEQRRTSRTSRMEQRRKRGDGGGWRLLRGYLRMDAGAGVYGDSSSRVWRLEP